MSKPPPAWLPDYVRRIGDALGLRDWTLDVAPEPLREEGTAAKIDFADCRRAATVHFAADFAETDREEQRLIVVHECLHCHINRCYHALNAVCDAHLFTQATYDLAYAQQHRAVEEATDGIACAVAPFFPLPPEPPAPITVLVCDDEAAVKAAMAALGEGRADS